MSVRGRKKDLSDVIFFFFAIALFIAIVLFSFLSNSRPPHIKGITPLLVHLGDVVVVTGRHFGTAEKPGSVYISGQLVTRKHYTLWSATEIRFTVTDNIFSGFLTIVTEKGESKPHLLTRADTVESVRVGYEERVKPEILYFDPDTVYSGDRLAIVGRNFGDEPYDASVLFSHGTDNWISADVDDRIWSDTEIIVTVPAGLSEARVRVSTRRGSTENNNISISSRGGKIVYGDSQDIFLKQQAVLSYSAKPESVHIWFPEPMHSVTQPLVEMLGNKDRIPEMLIPMENNSLTQIYKIRLLGAHTIINPSKVSQTYELDELFRQRYLTEKLSAPLLAPIRAFASEAVGGEKNPYYKAEKIFLALLSRMKPGSDAGPFAYSNIADSFIEGKGNAYDYAAVYAAALRAAEVPARVCTGLLINGDQTLNHSWAEFFLEDFGWVPVDPFLGDGMYSGQIFTGLFVNRKNYFGNMDTIHIAFKNNARLMSAIDPTAQGIYHAFSDYSLQYLQGYFHGTSRFTLHYEQPVLIQLQ